MLAELSGQDYVMIVGAVFAGISPLVLAYFQWRMWMQINGVSKDVKRIEKQTNSLTQKLVEATDDAAYSDGQLDERERAEKATSAKQQAEILAVIGNPKDGDVSTDIANVEAAVKEKK